MQDREVDLAAGASSHFCLHLPPKRTLQVKASGDQTQPGLAVTITISRGVSFEGVCGPQHQRCALDQFSRGGDGVTEGEVPSGTE